LDANHEEVHPVIVNSTDPVTCKRMPSFCSVYFFIIIIVVVVVVVV